MGCKKLIEQGILFFTRARVYSFLSALLVLMSLFCDVHAANTTDFANLSNADQKVKYSALQNLANQHGPEVADALVTALRRESDVRFSIALLDRIVQTHQERVVPQLAPLLKNKNVMLRKCTAESIGILGGPLAETTLVAALKSEKDSTVQTALLHALSSRATSESVEAVRAALSSDKQNVRGIAIQVLGRMTGTEALDALKAHHENDPALKKQLAEEIAGKAKASK